MHQWCRKRVCCWSVHFSCTTATGDSGRCGCASTSRCSGHRCQAEAAPRRPRDCAARTSSSATLAKCSTSGQRPSAPGSKTWSCKTSSTSQTSSPWSPTKPSRKSCFCKMKKRTFWTKVQICHKKKKLLLWQLTLVLKNQIKIKSKI